jgi:DNA-binding IclR family transcriptional regulator
MHATFTRPPEGGSNSPAVVAARESTRPIRALGRGLEVLTELNRLERAAINTLAAAVALPRTTTYRILETLRLAGYVDRDDDDCYRPTILVRALAEGFRDHRREPVPAATPHGAAQRTVT